MNHRERRHDTEDCHHPSEHPAENLEVFIETNDRPNGEINIGLFANGQWFRLGNIPIREEDILCWHPNDS